MYALVLLLIIKASAEREVPADSGSCARADSTDTEGCGAPSLLQLQKQQTELNASAALTGISVSDLQTLTDTADASVQMSSRSKSEQGKKGGKKKGGKKGKKGKKAGKKAGKKGKKGKKNGVATVAGTSAPTPAPTLSVEDLLDGEVIIYGFKKFGDGFCATDEGTVPLCYMSNGHASKAYIQSSYKEDWQCAIFCNTFSSWCQGFTVVKSSRSVDADRTCCVFPYPDKDPEWESGHVEQFSSTMGKSSTTVTRSNDFTEILNYDKLGLEYSASTPDIITTTVARVPFEEEHMECYLSKKAFRDRISVPTPPPTVQGECHDYCSGNVNSWNYKCGWNTCKGCKQCEGKTFVPKAAAPGKR